MIGRRDEWKKIISSTNEERKRIEEALKKYVEVRRWRVFMLMTNSYITWLLQQRSGIFAKLLRENHDKGVSDGLVYYLACLIHLQTIEIGILFYKKNSLIKWMKKKSVFFFNQSMDKY
jgi:hypothetical protein